MPSRNRSHPTTPERLSESRDPSPASDTLAKQNREEDPRRGTARKNIEAVEQELADDQDDAARRKAGK